MREIEKSNFIEWISSFSGCDGGNPKGAIWLCGIEYAGETESLVFIASDEPPCFYENDAARADFFNYPYNRNAIKLLAAMSGKTMNWRQFFLDEGCFGRGSGT